MALTLIAGVKLEPPATSSAESAFVSPAPLSAAAQTQTKHILREEWAATLETAVPAYRPDHTVRVVSVLHWLAAQTPVEGPRLRLDDADGERLPAHTERHMGTRRGSLLILGLSGWIASDVMALWLKRLSGWALIGAAGLHAVLQPSDDPVAWIVDAGLFLTGAGLIWLASRQSTTAVAQ